jgi:hypothetical protein
MLSIVLRGNFSRGRHANLVTIAGHHLPCCVRLACWCTPITTHIQHKRLFVRALPVVTEGDLALADNALCL